MPEHDLLLQINDKVGTILTEIGGMRSDTRNQNIRIECIERENIERDQKIDALTQFANDLTKERRIAIWLAGGVSAVVSLSLAVLSYFFRR
jgi:hypothetical protein